MVIWTKEHHQCDCEQDHGTPDRDDPRCIVGQEGFSWDQNEVGLDDVADTVVRDLPCKTKKRCYEQAYCGVATPKESSADLYTMLDEDQTSVDDDEELVDCV